MIHKTCVAPKCVKCWVRNHGADTIFCVKCIGELKLAKRFIQLEKAWASEKGISSCLGLR